MIIIESITSKNVQKFISTISTPNGHDCWGKTEFDTTEVVYINGKSETIYKGYYIAHDNENAICVGNIEYLPAKMAAYLSPNIKRKQKMDRYKNFLKLQKEFSAETPENIEIRRENGINNIL
jgi:hypothetical protein